MKLSKLRANTSMRKLAGTTIPRQDTTSFGMRNALKRAAGGRCMGDVSGKPMRPSLAKPGRKRGGAVGKWDGGRLSGDSEQKARAAEAKDTGPIGPKTLGAGATLGAGLVTLGKAFSRKTPIGRALTAGTGAGITYGGAKLAKDDFERMQEGTAAAKEARDIRAKKPIESQEDRKFGGRAKRRAKDNDGDDC